MVLLGAVKTVIQNKKKKNNTGSSIPKLKKEFTFPPPKKDKTKIWSTRRALNDNIKWLAYYRMCVLTLSLKIILK